MDVKVEVDVFSITAEIIGGVVKGVTLTVFIPSQKTSTFSCSLVSFGSTSRSAISPDLNQNGGLYALV